MAEFKQLKVDFPIPEMLQNDIDALEEGIKNNVSYIDCLQCEVWSSARSCFCFFRKMPGVKGK